MDCCLEQKSLVRRVDCCNQRARTSCARSLASIGRSRRAPVVAGASLADVRGARARSRRGARRGRRRGRRRQRRRGGREVRRRFGGGRTIDDRAAARTKAAIDRRTAVVVGAVVVARPSLTRSNLVRDRPGRDDASSDPSTVSRNARSRGSNCRARGHRRKNAPSLSFEDAVVVFVGEMRCGEHNKLGLPLSRICDDDALFD